MSIKLRSQEPVRSKKILTVLPLTKRPIGGYFTRGFAHSRPSHLGWIERTLAYAFIASVALNFFNVVGRYGFGVTILSADEAQVFIMIFMTFLGAAVVAWREQHLRMDVLVHHVTALGKLVHLAELATVATLACFVLWNSSYYVKQMFIFGRVSDMGHVPYRIRTVPWCSASA